MYRNMTALLSFLLPLQIQGSSAAMVIYVEKLKKSRMSVQKDYRKLAFFISLKYSYMYILYKCKGPKSGYLIKVYKLQH